MEVEVVELLPLTRRWPAHLIIVIDVLKIIIFNIVTWRAYVMLIFLIAVSNPLATRRITEAQKNQTWKRQRTG